MKRGHVREDGMVFLRRARGKEVWGTQADWEKHEATRIRLRDKYRENHKTARKYKIGEYIPETGLYFIRSSGNYKPLFGTLEQVDAYRQQKRKFKVDYKEKNKGNIDRTIQNKGVKHRRGDIDPILNLVFWRYNNENGREVWIDRERYEQYSKKSNWRRKN